MSPSLIILKRTVILPKAQWRARSTRRTLDPLAIEQPVHNALQEWRGSSISPAIVESEIDINGTETRQIAVRKAKRTDSSGVFQIEYVGKDVRLTLLEEACSREVHWPRRPSRYLVTLTVWKPVRVLLNGQADWDRERYYYLQDYHVLACDHSQEALSPGMQFFDLQADLM
ncbi:MAG TPA: hypothetical protein VMZ52_01320 [Bryobacteraceae bacterium]|nr:hypothetical protein [Bryobacteraceae bacterium]